MICDPVRLKQILINLLDNACKFCNSGSVTLNVKRVKENALKFEIFDTGIGIDEKNYSKIIKPFTQMEQSDTRRFSGSGLGLTICNELLVAMNSSLSIYSKIEEGCCFSFTLNLTSETGNHLENDKAELTKYKILLVDDTKANLKITGELLTILKQDVTSANSSRLAILKSMKEKFDILFIDFHMPEKKWY